MSRRTAIIIGAGPAGLTAAYELLTRTDVVPVVLEKSSYMGGISRTVNHHGNRIDVGGHRFFSKSDRVMDWWLSHLPLESPAARGQTIAYHSRTRLIPSGACSSDRDGIMLVRRRKSRIYFAGKFFDYPVKLNPATLWKLGLARTVRIVGSYGFVRLFPPRNISNLEQFLISRFGRELYRTFFQGYTEKVWGVPCTQISAEWGAQRIKGVSIMRMLRHMVKSWLKSDGSIQQKNTETSLIEQFLYPALGPGHLWEVVARKIVQLGGQILTNFDVDRIVREDEVVQSVSGRDEKGDRRSFAGEYFFSTMPVRELLAAVDPPAPAVVRAISDGLQYRDFITIGLLVRELAVRDGSCKKLIEDNWIYIQEENVSAGRVQIFNNWSSYMVADPNTVWMGVEYFCNDSDPLWSLPDADLVDLATRELVSIGMLAENQVLDATVIRMPKAYPGYFGSYGSFDEVRRYTDTFPNLFLIGRNGMHRYNNQDHSMLTAMVAVDNILAGRESKTNIWGINTETEYHEEQAESPQTARAGLSSIALDT